MESTSLYYNSHLRDVVFVYVIACFSVVFGINSTSNADRKVQNSTRRSLEISLLQLATELGETPTFDLQLHPSRTNVEFKPAASGELQHFKDKNLDKNTTKSTATLENHFEALLRLLV